MIKYPQLAIILFLMQNGCNLNSKNNRGMQAVNIVEDVAVTSFLEFHAQEFHSEDIVMQDIEDLSSNSGSETTSEKQKCIICSKVSIVIEFPGCKDITDVFCSPECASWILRCITCRCVLDWGSMVPTSSAALSQPADQRNAATHPHSGGPNVYDKTTSDVFNSLFLGNLLYSQQASSNTTELQPCNSEYLSIYNTSIPAVHSRCFNSH